jgi:hypothetical protein
MNRKISTRRQGSFVVRGKKDPDAKANCQANDVESSTLSHCRKIDNTLLVVKRNYQISFIDLRFYYISSCSFAGHCAKLSRVWTVDCWLLTRNPHHTSSLQLNPTSHS